MTNSGFPITIGDETYETTQLGQASWDYLVNCLRMDFIEQQNEVLRVKSGIENLPIDQREVQAIRQQAFGFNRRSIVATNWFFTDTGVCHLLHQLLKPKQPKITLVMIKDWNSKGMIGMEQWKVIEETLTAGSPISKGDGGSEEGNPPTPANSTPS